MSIIDTIYAVSSGAGTSGIAVVRMSGSSSKRIMLDIVGVVPAARRVSLRVLRQPRGGEIIDQAVVVWIPGPGSATGEDVCEFHVHGSQPVVAGLFEIFNGYDGVRPAEAGEFTRRAFLNGRMDLVEVEGLGDLLEARTSAQRRQAIHQFFGDASSVFDSWRLQLVELIASVEAGVDFSEEDGVGAAALEGLEADATALIGELQLALAESVKASAIREGVKVVLAGRPNTGKSSLLNAISRRDVAIVSAIPGTTRDIVEVLVDLGGVPVILMDTAGLRAGSKDEIEVIGMARARNEVDRADIVVWVSSPDVAGSDIPERGVQPDFWISNKSDIQTPELRLNRNESGPVPVLLVSAVCGDGVGEFIVQLSNAVRDRFGAAERSVVVRDRQKQAILESIRFINDSRLHGAGHLELVAADLRRAADALGRVTGRIDVEEWLGAIFSRFCVGK
jgi:tRNA modification GTPase